MARKLSGEYIRNIGSSSITGYHVALAYTGPALFFLVALDFSCPVATVSDYRSKPLLPRVVASLFCLLLFARTREVVPIPRQRLLTVRENMVTMISDTYGYVPFLLLLLLVPYIESGKSARILLFLGYTRFFGPDVPLESIY